MKYKISIVKKSVFIDSNNNFFLRFTEYQQNQGIIYCHNISFEMVVIFFPMTLIHNVEILQKKILHLVYSFFAICCQTKYESTLEISIREVLMTC